MTDWTPKTNIAEVHLTYRCNLRCIGCNRLSYLPPTTPDMTLADFQSFVDQCRGLGWSPIVYLMGGEPTLHDDLAAFCRLAAELSPGRVTIISNAYGVRAQTILAEIEATGLASVSTIAQKRDGSVLHKIRGYHLAPKDEGLSRAPCYTHAGRKTTGCGISVDAVGYTVCAPGGAMDSVLGLGLRTSRLADLFDKRFAAEQTRKLCEVCGAHKNYNPQRFRGMKVLHGVAMSPTWSRAVLDIEALGD
jgi:hypothetical protein